ncbi:MAG: cation transporter [Magnetococcales bacterium]|nr:cation transporter [Magnetococcales bacterium]
MSELESSRKETRYIQARRVTQVGTAGDTLLTIGKISAGLLTQSSALLAEGLHSGADLLFDVVVLLGMKIAKRKPDESHPYGHGKFEGLFTLFLSALLLLVAVGVVWDAIHRMGAGDLHAPDAWAFWVALLSIVTKEGLFQYTVRVGRRLKSNIIMANAWHHRADSISSFAAMLGIGGALLGYPILDPVAAIVVAFFVSKVGFEIGWDAIKELTDASDAVDEEIRQRINHLINEIPDVLSAHFVTARQLGPDIVVDVHVVVPLCLSASEGHQVAEQVKYTLLKQVDAITEVVVHVDTEDDMERTIPMQPSREVLLDWVFREIPEGRAVVGVVRLQPNYTSRGIYLDLVLEADESYSFEAVHEEAQQLCGRLLNGGKGILEVRTSLASAEQQHGTLAACKVSA